MKKEKDKYARQKRYKQKQKFKAYNNFIYCLDIETSTQNGTNVFGDSVPCSFIISYAISKIDINTGEIMHDSFKRTYNDLQNDLERIKEESGDRKTLIYCHNFAYEWSFFKDNVEFFKDNLTRAMFMKRHKPLLIDCNNLSFRCSYLLLNKSVATLGSELTASLGENWDKLEFDYNKNRTPLSEIDEMEINYNYRDCDIVLKYIYEKLLKQYTIKELYEKIYTKTGIVRFDNKKFNSNTDYKQFLIFNKEAVPDTFKQYSIEQLTFLGGLVSCDFNILNKPLKNVGSFDASSDYPFQMLKPYPTHFIENEELKDIKNFNKFRSDPKYNKHKFFYAKIEIKNLKLTKYDYAILSNHKFFESVDCETIFGKVIKAKRGFLICTSLDFENYKKFYDFDVVRITDIYTNKYMNYLPSFIIKSVARLLKAKSQLKVYNNEVEHKGFLYNKYDFGSEYKYIQDIINSQSDYQLQIAIMSQYYHEAKGKLNSMYGILCEKGIKSEIEYDFENMQYKVQNGSFEEFKNKRFIKTNMAVATFITAYARTHLIKLLLLCLDNGIRVYYTDTDSLKLDYSNPEKVNKIVDEYNATIFKNPYNIGQFDFEGCYDDFVINGNKSYMSVKNGVIKATVAGLPGASFIYQKLYDRLNKDFKKLVANCFSFNIEILPEVTDKLTSKYPVTYEMQDEEIDFRTQLIHLQIGNYDDFVYTGLILDDCPVTIKGVDTSLSNLKSIKNLHKFYNFDYNDCIKKHQIFLNRQWINGGMKQFVDVKEIGTINKELFKEGK